jgi:hypothetical protein
MNENPKAILANKWFIKELVGAVFVVRRESIAGLLRISNNRWNEGKMSCYLLARCKLSALAVLVVIFGHCPCASCCRLDDFVPKRA